MVNLGQHKNDQGQVLIFEDTYFERFQPHQPTTVLNIKIMIFY